MERSTEMLLAVGGITAAGIILYRLTRSASDPSSIQPPQTITVSPLDNGKNFVLRVGDVIAVKLPKIPGIMYDVRGPDWMAAGPADVTTDPISEIHPFKPSQSGMNGQIVVQPSAGGVQSIFNVRT